MTAVPMGSGGEFDRIRAIAKALGVAAGPIGDDTAAIPAGDGVLVVSTDSSVENVHFRREWLSVIEIGWRATASALSDLAASAATPAGVTVAVIVPSSLTEADLVALMAGVGDAATASGCQVLGGDLSVGTELAVQITVFGYASPAPVARRGARVGDHLYVTGVLGGARAALLDWVDDVAPSMAARLAFAHPRPRIPAGRWLASQGATAMMDLSDGLAGDAGHLAAASGVRLEIVLDQLPIHPSVHRVARRKGERFAPFAAIGGEDYELLVAMPPEFAASRDCEPASGVPLTRIGQVGAGSGVAMTLSGEPITLTGYRHAL